ncbi:MAG: SDR family oxidoreductase [Candidatus Omnitrophica bacterium]|nr:SDR family oxidoreductase [Candidatus Omnitrophota bacterium]
MNFGIKDKKVLVTGASKGIGAAIARAFAAEGCRLSLIARNKDKLKQLFEEIGGTVKGHEFLSIDLMEPGAPTKAVKSLLKDSDPFDIVVHNVGGALGLKDIFAPLGDWADVWRFNVGIAIEMNRILIPPMRQRKWGRVVHLSSISGDLGEPLEPFGGAIPYAAAKAYLNAYVKGLGRELARDNVIISGVMPGAALSEGKYWDKTVKNDPVLAKKFLDHYYPIGRFGKPEEIAPFVVLLASERATFAAGTLIPVSGGRV